ncbi:MAG TPA: hemerythrin domain-containing protein [Kofleriaceae bacterium]
MSQPPSLLDAEGHASIATGVMMSHHAFRRDLALFEGALARIESGDTSRVSPVREEWNQFHVHLHGHHTAEDTGIFPSLTAEHAALAPIIAKLADDHHQLEQVLVRGDEAFAALPDIASARAVVTDLVQLLDQHLALEEAEIIPFLRHSASFAPGSEEELAMYAEGFAWSARGIADDIVETVFATLPTNLRERLPAARAAFEQRSTRTWGATEPTRSRTPIPGR